MFWWRQNLSLKSSPKGRPQGVHPADGAAREQGREDSQLANATGFSLHAGGFRQNARFRRMPPHSQAFNAQNCGHNKESRDQPANKHMQWTKGFVMHPTRAP